jgi:transposase-like protein
MKPLTYFEQIIKMPNKADKFDLGLRMVKHALIHGVEPAARVFDTTAKTVRKWLRRYRQERLAGLNELPRILLTCPHKSSASTEKKVVLLRKQYPFMGAKRLKREHNLSCSHGAMRICAEHKVVCCGAYKFGFACYDAAGNQHAGTPRQVTVDVHIAPEKPTGLKKNSYNKTTDVLVLDAA